MIVHGLGQSGTIKQLGLMRKEEKNGTVGCGGANDEFRREKIVSKETVPISMFVPSWLRAALIMQSRTLFLYSGNKLHMFGRKNPPCIVKDCMRACLSVIEDWFKGY